MEKRDKSARERDRAIKRTRLAIKKIARERVRSERVERQRRRDVARTSDGSRVNLAERVIECGSFFAALTANTMLFCYCCHQLKPSREFLSETLCEQCTYVKEKP